MNHTTAVSQELVLSSCLTPFAIGYLAYCNFKSFKTFQSKLILLMAAARPNYHIFMETRKPKGSVIVLTVGRKSGRRIFVLRSCFDRS